RYGASPFEPRMEPITLFFIPSPPVSCSLSPASALLVLTIHFRCLTNAGQHYRLQRSPLGVIITVCHVTENRPILWLNEMSQTNDKRFALKFIPSSLIALNHLFHLSNILECKRKYSNLL
uniref:Uncharacterized protein n=1 Tax=Parascaris univalens TaxID=6257 RepID=A0A915AGN6_PARUN